MVEIAHHKDSGMFPDEVKMIFTAIDQAAEIIKDRKLMIMEIGSYLGGTAEMIYQYCFNSGYQFKFGCLDIYRDGDKLNDRALRKWLEKHWRRILEGSMFMMIASTRHRNMIQFPIDVLVLDACHCYTCTKDVFQKYEQLVASKGFVLFHDSGIQAQTYYQGFGIHCTETEYGVRKALNDLGLLTGERPGWKLVNEIQGEKGIICFQRI